MAKQKSRYSERGVSSSKEDVHAAIKNLGKGLYPNAFCKILADHFTKNELYAIIKHADGAGTKSVLAYLYWRVTGDLSVWKGIMQDSIVMNIDDLACVGFTREPCYLTSTIQRNKRLVPGEVVKALIEGGQQLTDEWRKYGINLLNQGGETADLGDVVRTITVDSDVATRMKRKDIIVPQIKPGNVVVGLASDGIASYETGALNSGIGSNGLTSARNDIFGGDIKERFPEAWDQQTDKPELSYCGKYGLEDTYELSPVRKPRSIAKMVLSPTRTYLPILIQLLKNIDRKKIKGIIHCSGGGQTKVLNFLRPGVQVVKDHLFEPPAIFKIIQNESGETWENMYQIFNMGHRMEVYCDEKTAEIVIEASQSFNVNAQIIGHCHSVTPIELKSKSEVLIKSPHGIYFYQREHTAH